jgi:hypothetical protein
MGTGGPFPGAKRGRGVTLTTHPHLVPRSRMSRSYNLLSPQVPPWRVAGLLCSSVYFGLRYQWSRLRAIWKWWLIHCVTIMPLHVFASEISEESSNSSKNMECMGIAWHFPVTRWDRRVGTPITLSGLELEIVWLLGKQNALSRDDARLVSKQSSVAI